MKWIFLFYFLQISCKEESLVLYSDDPKIAEAWSEAIERAIRKANDDRQTLRKPSSHKIPLRGRSLRKHRQQQKKAGIQVQSIHCLVLCVCVCDYLLHDSKVINVERLSNASAKMHLKDSHVYTGIEELISIISSSLHLSFETTGIKYAI